jgi:hypothetical protein
LIGNPLCWTSEDTEISQFRRSMFWVRYQISKEKEAKQRAEKEAMEAKLGNSTSTPDGKLMVKLRLPLLEASLEKTVIVGGT